MTEREITGLALRLFAIYILIQMLLAVPSLINAFIMVEASALGDSGTMWLWFAGVAVIIISLGLAWFLWKKGLNTTRTEHSTNAASSISNVEPAIFTALGIFLVIQALVRLSYLFTGAYVQSINSYNEDIPLSTITSIIAYLFQVVIGTSLMLRTKGWINVLNKLRHAGLTSKTP